VKRKTDRREITRIIKKFGRVSNLFNGGLNLLFVSHIHNTGQGRPTGCFNLLCGRVYGPRKLQNIEEISVNKQKGTNVP
jgi:hypothetical protein